MKQSYYLFRNGTIKRKDNTLRLETEEGEIRDIPVERVEDIFCFGEMTFGTNFLSFLSKNGICMHMFNYYENYVGTYYPREGLLSGNIHIRQAEHYIDGDKRLTLAKAFLTAGVYNIERNLRYYDERGRDFHSALQEIRFLRDCIDSANDVTELMGIEGNIRKLYYACWEDVLLQDVDFKKRVRKPPDNMVNALISFCNMLVYSCIVTELYHTQLDPTISYLHQPGDRRFSLSLDFSEVFKPILCDRLIFSLINKRQISSDSFETKCNGLLLKDAARKSIVAEFDKRLKQTIKHKGIGRCVSYRRLIRLDAYRLIKHLLDEEPYEGFRLTW